MQLHLCMWTIVSHSLILLIIYDSIVVSADSSCDPGYENNEGECTACPVGKYKQLQGDEMCVECPPNSHSTVSGATSCNCTEGFYRTVNENVTVKCTAPPSKPEKFFLESVGSTFISIDWFPPTDTGGRTDISYAVMYHTSESYVYVYLFNTQYNITRLTPSTLYIIRVISVNGVSDQEPNTVTSRTTTIVVKTIGDRQANGSSSNDTSSIPIATKTTTTFTSLHLTITLGTLFLFILLIVIIITNISLRLYQAKQKTSFVAKQVRHDQTSNENNYPQYDQIQLEQVFQQTKSKQDHDNEVQTHQELGSSADDVSVHITSNPAYNKVEKNKNQTVDIDKEYLDVISDSPVQEMNTYDLDQEYLDVIADSPVQEMNVYDLDSQYERIRMSNHTSSNDHMHTNLKENETSIQALDDIYI